MRILMYDLEVTPALAWTYEMWDTNVIKLERPSYIMCFAYKWHGENNVKVVAQPDFGWYDKDPYSDYCVVEELWKLMDEADIVVAHNATKFDNKIAAARFLYNSMTPPSPYRTVDTLTAARKYFRMGKNSLDFLCGQLDIGTKAKTKHHELWYDCVNGDLDAWRKMKRYCKQDVVLLDRLYNELLPYITSHPNVSVADTGQACPRCGSTNLQSRGMRYSYTNVSTYRRLYCNDCGAWSRERVRAAEGPQLVSA